MAVDAISTEKTSNDLRLVTFNVNGLRTLFHFKPFSEMNQSLEKVFDYFKADIITFQELKTDINAINRWGKVNGYHSYITVPKNKKGYSGVGCWVRVPHKNDPLYNVLRVLKAEEGVTGYLTFTRGKEKIKFKDDITQGIGGYEDLGIVDENTALELDSEGRCVIIELACNTVVFSVYCPANSTNTDEGETFRLKFLNVLLKRIRNLKNLGKNVILMGDINICKDLIDHAECLEKSNVPLLQASTGTQIESDYKKATEDFILNFEAPQRRLLNQLCSDSIIPELATSGIMVDSTRIFQGRARLKMYTVWNTLKNLRPINYGSRIDFILVNSELKSCIKFADILPRVMGSDHCPVFTDLAITENFFETNLHKETSIPRFEARYKYNLQNHNILSMLTSRRTLESNNSKSKVVKPSPGISQTSRKSRKSIDKFFKSEDITPPTTKINKEDEKEWSQILQAIQVAPKKPSKENFSNIFGEVPKCKHNQKAIIKTSKTLSNNGRKFWVCPKPKGDETSNFDDVSCDFFQWA